MKKLTQERLKEVLNYNPTTGIFIQKKKRQGVCVGNEAGYLGSNGYRYISIDGKNYRSHRLVWLFIEGYLPENEIDHLNGKRNDNRLSNLREASRRCNAQNCKIYLTNTSGFPGVSWSKRYKNWQAKIMINNKHYYLGSYDTALDAALARLTEEVNNTNWHCNHRGELVKAIKRAWPDFNEKSLGI